MNNIYSDKYDNMILATGDEPEWKRGYYLDIPATEELWAARQELCND